MTKTRRFLALLVVLSLLAVLAYACAPPTPTIGPTPTPAPTATIQLARSPTPTPAPTATIQPARSPTLAPAPTATIQPARSQTPTPASNPGQGSVQVHFIDVGQGDSILIQAPDGKNMLIDGGEANGKALQYLQSHSVTRLDLVVATHPHSDHIGGLVEVLQTIPTAKVVTNGEPHTTLTYERFLDAIAGARAEYAEVKIHDQVALGGLVFDVLSPFPQPRDDMNEDSVVLSLQYGTVGFLFMGDAGKETEAALQQLSSLRVPAAQVLKVAHHGSRSSSSPAFLALVKPEVAVYSAATGNSYGHPHAETLAALAAVGATVYGTDVNGTVVVATDGSTYRVEAQTGQARAPPVPVVPPIANPTAAPPTPTVIRTTPTPTARPTATRVTATATPTPSVLAPGALTLEIVSVTSPVPAGSKAALSARTAPGASCDITVYYKSGPGTAQGLYPKQADASGNVSWTWTVGTRTTSGNWRIVVTASKDGQNVAKETTFTVV